jgi:hypothetical protein
MFVLHGGEMTNHKQPTTIFRRLFTGEGRKRSSKNRPSVRHNSRKKSALFFYRLHTREWSIRVKWCLAKTVLLSHLSSRSIIMSDKQTNRWISLNAF